jgi:hypothetical protein
MKTSELTGAALDWVAAKCEGVSVRWSAAHEQLLVEGYPYMVWQPSTNWAQGGPIIEREIDVLERYRLNINTIAWDATAQGNDQCTATGPTPLIAAMRCYVASKLDNEVNVPEELEDEPETESGEDLAQFYGPSTRI